MIRTVVRNLVANALKFTDKGGVITISTSSYNEQTLVTVSDTGVGINPGDVSKLFGNSSNWTTAGTANEKGSGLGLQLCKEFVEKNNGKIWVESEPGKGSRFMFTIPRIDPANTEQQNPVSVESDGTDNH
jgi:signal transduction histidine kinase